MREGIPLGRPDWLSIPRLDQPEVLRALRDWCRRQIDEPMRPMGTQADVAIVRWYGTVLGWAWTSGRFPAHRIWVLKLDRPVEPMGHSAWWSLVSDRILIYLARLKAHEVMQYFFALSLLPYGDLVLTQVHGIAAEALGEVCDRIRSRPSLRIEPITLAGLILLSQTVARQVQAAGEIGHKGWEEASR